MTHAADMSKWSGLLGRNIDRIVTEVTKAPNLAQIFLSIYLSKPEGVPNESALVCELWDIHVFFDGHIAIEKFSHI